MKGRRGLESLQDWDQEVPKAKIANCATELQHMKLSYVTAFASHHFTIPIAYPITYTVVTLTQWSTTVLVELYLMSSHSLGTFTRFEVAVEATDPLYVSLSCTSITCHLEMAWAYFELESLVDLGAWTLRLYTSGSTGTPKGVVRDTGGYAVPGLKLRSAKCSERKVHVFGAILELSNFNWQRIKPKINPE